MRLLLLLFFSITACWADELAHAAGQIFSNILPNLNSNQVTNQNNNATNTFQQIGTVVGGVENYAKNKSYEDLLRQAQDAITDEDLLQLSEEIFKSDVNNAFNDIQVNLQGKTSSISKTDEALSNLFNVPSSFWYSPKITHFVDLFDNYEKNVLHPEFVTSNRENEQVKFINTILATGPIRTLMNFLVSKGLTQLNDNNEQVQLLKKIWFTKYARHWTGFCKCSSAFENIFMVELNSDTVLGLHSWLFFAKLESDHEANYLGYIDKLDLSGKGLILKQHSVLSETKDAPEITMFVGTSPELETALYTLCFMARPDRPCRLRTNNVPFTISTKTIRAENIPVIDTAAPSY